jgi:hypothetical protein
MLPALTHNAGKAGKVIFERSFVPKPKLLAIDVELFGSAQTGTTLE